MGERALDLMARRALARTVFKRLIAEHGGFQQQLARCRINLDAARLTVLDAAHALDQVGNKQVRYSDPAVDLVGHFKRRWGPAHRGSRRQYCGWSSAAPYSAPGTGAASAS